MNRLTKWVRMFFQREPQDPVPEVEPLQSVVTPARVQRLADDQRHSRQLDKRFEVLGRVLSDYQAQDGVLMRRRR